METELRIIEEGPKVEIHFDAHKATNRKTSGQEGKHGLWFKKKITLIHDRLASEMNKCKQKTEIREWMTKYDVG